MSGHIAKGIVAADGHTVYRAKRSAERQACHHHRICLLIEAALGIESGFWLKMQMNYDIQTTKQNKTFAQRLADIRKIAAAL